MNTASQTWPILARLLLRLLKWASPSCLRKARTVTTGRTTQHISVFCDVQREPCVGGIIDLTGKKRAHICSNMRAAGKSIGSRQTGFTNLRRIEVFNCYYTNFGCLVCLFCLCVFESCGFKEQRRVPGGQEHSWPTSLAVRNFGIRAATFCKHTKSTLKCERKPVKCTNVESEIIQWPLITAIRPQSLWFKCSANSFSKHWLISIISGANPYRVGQLREQFML